MKQKILLFRVGPFGLSWPFFTAFWILGRYKKSKRKTLSKFVPLPEASFFPIIIIIIIIIKIFI